MRESFCILVSIAFVLVFIDTVFCDNVTAKYPSGNFKTRQGKLLTFNTDKDDEIHVELDFAVPFLSIPVKPSMDMAHGTKANLNLGAIALAGMMAFGAAVVIPATYHLFENKLGKFNNPYTEENGRGDRRYINDAESSSTLWAALTAIDKALSENNIDSTSCIQRALCWTVQNSNSKLSKGEATSMDKIIDGLATNSYLQYLVDGSVFRAAIDSGLNGINCSTEYRQCKVNQKNIQSFGKQFINAIYNR